MADLPSAFKKLGDEPTPGAPAAPAPAAGGGLDIVGRAKAALTAEPPPGSPRSGVAGQIVRGAGEVMLPGSIPEAAFLVGTLGASKVFGAAAKVAPYVAKLPPAIGRIILGSITEGAATALEGEGFLKGAKHGAASGAIGETAGAVGGAVVGKAIEKVPGVAAARGAQVASRRAEVAGNVGEFAGRVPPLKGAKTAEGLDAMLKDKGTQRSLGEYYHNRVSEAEGIIGPETTIRVPSLAQMGPETPAAMTFAPPPGVQVMRPGELKSTSFAGAAPPQASTGDRMTLREASERLKELGPRAYGAPTKDPMTRTISGAQQRELYGKAKKEIEAELASFPGGDKALQAWTDGRHAYAVGNELMRVFKDEGIFKRSADKIELNTTRLQQVVSKHRARIEQNLGPDDWQAFKKAVFTGGRVGTVDVVPKHGAPQFTGPKTTTDFPVNIPRIMIDSAVNRVLPAGE